MSLKKKLEEGLDRIGDKFEGIDAKSGEYEKRFLDKHADSIDRMHDRRDQAAERFGERLAKLAAWFERVKASFEERSARAKLKRDRHR